MRRWACLLALLGAPAAAQPAPAGIPIPLQGAWFAGGCAQPEALLFVTARAVARVPAAWLPAGLPPTGSSSTGLSSTGSSSSGAAPDAPAAEPPAARLYRFEALRDLAGEATGWTLGTAAGPEAPRLLLRAERDALTTIEPAAKALDAELPGDGPVGRWARCPAPPLAVLALHAEGLAMLAALEHIEAGCAPDAAAACLRALLAAADVTGDGLLSAAELARLARGVAWVVAVADGVSGERLAGAVGIGALAGLLVRGVVDSLDYDGDGRVSAAELEQDRAAFGAARGTPAGAPLPGNPIGSGLDALRGLLTSLGLTP